MVLNTSVFQEFGLCSDIQKRSSIPGEIILLVSGIFASVVRLEGLWYIYDLVDLSL